jgi:hypothetical protein
MVPPPGRLFPAPLRSSNSGDDFGHSKLKIVKVRVADVSSGTDWHQAQEKGFPVGGT